MMNRFRGTAGLSAFVGFLSFSALAAVQVDFSRGKWKADDWKIVKGPRWDYCHGFVQRDGWIENETPQDLSPEQVFKTCGSAVYSGMVWKDKFSIGSTFAMTTGWDWRMAPLMVIAPELGVSKDGRHPEFREHWEVVIYDEGLNVWHHYWTPEKGPHWVKAASLSLPKDSRFKPNEKHRLEVRVVRNGKGRKEMFCSCGGFTLQYVDDSLPDSFYVGILGCEGRNLFWDFSAR